MVIGFAAFIVAPRWVIHSFGSADRADYHRVQEWNSDGTALLTTGSPGLQVLGDDGSVMLSDQSKRATSVVWADAHTLLILEYASPSTYRLFRMATSDGRRHMIGEPLPYGFLMADRLGNVALRNAEGPLTTRILDAGDGRILAKLDGFRPVRWTDHGSLILGRLRAPLVEGGLASEELFEWAPGQPTRRLGEDLLDAGSGTAVPASGGAIACVCVPESALVAGGDPAIYLVPLDGSKATRMASRSIPEDSSPEMALLDETSLAVIDESGVSLVTVAAGRTTYPSLSAADLGFTKVVGRVYPMRGGFLAMLRDGADDTGDTLLVVADAQERITLRRWLHTRSLTDIAIDPSHGRVVISGDPQHAFGPKTELFVLELD